MLGIIRIFVFRLGSESFVIAFRLVRSTQSGRYPMLVMVWWNTMFYNQEWSFQLDSKPGHKARSTEVWLEINISAIIGVTGAPGIFSYRFRITIALMSKIYLTSKMEGRREDHQFLFFGLYFRTTSFMNRIIF